MLAVSAHGSCGMGAGLQAWREGTGRGRCDGTRGCGVQDRRAARQGRPVSAGPGTVRVRRPPVAFSQPGLIGPGLIGFLPVQPEVMRQVMFDVRVRSGEEEGHVAVVEPVHHVRRLPVRAAYVGDLSFAPMIVEVRSFDDQPITHLCPHVSRTPSTVSGTSVARWPLLCRARRPRFCRVAAASADPS